MTFLRLTLFSLITLPAVAQNRMISGYVQDAETHNALAFCNVILLPYQTGAITDNQGSFKMTIPSDASLPTLIFSYVGYKNDTLSLWPGQDKYAVYLKPAKGTLQEVVVTGVSKLTLLRESPISISGVSSRSLEKAAESNIIDVLTKNVPGLNAVKTGPNISKPFIRGLGYNRVLTLYDGIRQEGQQWGDEHGIEVDSYHMERAEIIKGPASLMYGSDAVAGVVSLFPFVHRAKDGRIRGKFISEYQSNNHLMGYGLRLGYGKGHWMTNVQGSFRLAGNYTNKIDKTVYNTGFSEKNASGSVGYSSSKGISQLNLTWYDNLQGIPDGSRDSLTRRFTRQVDEFPTDNVKNRPMVPDNELHSYQLSPLHQHIQHARIYSNHHYQIGKGDMDGSLGFQQNIRREYNHPRSPGQPGLYVRLNTMNYGVRYHLPEFSSLQISLGINGMVQDNKNKDATDFPIPDYRLLDVGSFGVAKWKHKRWTVSGGGRYDFRKVKGNDFYVRQNATSGSGEQVFLPDTAQAHLQFPALSKEYGGVSWSLGSTFLVTDNIGIKVNAAQGYRAPSITEIASAGLDPGAHILYLGNRNFVPEFNLQEDIGVSVDFKEYAASFSFFNNNIRHYIYLAQAVDAQGHPLVLDGGNKVFQYQQASAQLYGMEASLNIHPQRMKGFDMSSNFSVVYGFNRKEGYKRAGVKGEYLPFIPPVKILSTITQEIKTKRKFIPAINLKAEVEYNAGQNRFLALSQTETYTPGYALFNAALGFVVRDDKKPGIQFQFQVNNLLDAAYQSNLSRLKYFEYYASSPNGRSGIYGMGRSVCLKVIVPF
jgi:iron complex outermembrane receptor protein